MIENEQKYYSFPIDDYIIYPGHIFWVPTRLVFVEFIAAVVMLLVGKKLAGSFGITGSLLIIGTIHAYMAIQYRKNRFMLGYLKAKHFNGRRWRLRRIKNRTGFKGIEFNV